MSDDRFDDSDDIPTLEPLRQAEPSREELRKRYLKPGFGFWMAVMWCVLYLLATQIFPLFACGIPVIFVAMALEAAQAGKPPADAMQWMQSDTGVLSIVIILMITQLVGLLFGWLILRWQCGGRTWKRRIALSRRPSWTHMGLVVIGCPAMIVVGLAIEQPIMAYVPSIQDILNWANVPIQWPGIEAVEPLLKKTPWPLALFIIGICPALNEEFWCRGFLGQGLSGRYRAWAVILLTSFFFGCIHLELRQGLWAMFLGTAICCAYFATRSLWVPMFLHFANNGLAAIHTNERLGLPVLRPVEVLMEQSPLLLTTAATLLFVSVAYALYQTRCKLVALDPELPTWEPEGVSGVELPPPNSGTVVSHDPLSAGSAAAVLVAAIGFGLVLAFG